MKGDWITALLSCGLLLLAGCSAKAASVEQRTESRGTETFTRGSRIEDVQNDPAFGSFGRLLFPTNTYYYSGDTLEKLEFPYYSHIDPDGLRGLGQGRHLYF